MDVIEQRWQAWRAENPGALTALILLGRELLAEERARGRNPQLSSKLLFELARFRGLLDVTQADGYAWNNSFTALAARALMRMAPDLGFETRVRQVEKNETQRRSEEAQWTGRLFA